MNLQEQLDQMRKDFESSAPPEALEVMHKATADLQNSGLKDKTVKKGDALPEFSLPDQNKKNVSSGTLLQKGALVVSIYRGVW